MFIPTVKSNSANIHMLLTGFSVVKMESTSLYKLLACFLAVKMNSLNLYKLQTGFALVKTESRLVVGLLRFMDFVLATENLLRGM